MTAITAFVLAISTRLDFALLSAVSSGAGWVIATTGMYALLIERTPKDYSTAIATGYQQVVGVAIFVGPLLGSLLVGFHLTLVQILYITAVLRILAGMFTYMKTIPNQRPKFIKRLRRAAPSNVIIP